MKYLPDSNTCIRYLNGRSLEIARRIKSTPVDEIAVCSIVKAELYFGARRSMYPDQTRTKQDEFLLQFPSLGFDDACAEYYSAIHAELTRLGTPIGPNDLLIAAIALANQLTLVTHNTREFSRIQNLNIEDWEETAR